jgi:AraC-like DNA-binding protein
MLAAAQRRKTVRNSVLDHHHTTIRLWSPARKRFGDNLPDMRALAPYVASVVAYDVDLGAPGVHRGLPSTTLTFVLPAGEPLDVGWRDRPESRDRRWSTVSGLHAHPAEIHHDGHQAGVQLALTTAGARALLGLPAAALAGELLELDDVAPWLRSLPERLDVTPPDARVALVERTLLAELARRDVPGPRAEVGRALAGLTRGASVQAVADEVGYSRRHLADLIRAECGLGPKEVQRLGRFQASRALLGRLPLADVAHRCGYADQSHLSREWVALAGCPPTTWLREEFPFLQDVGEPEASG